MPFGEVTHRWGATATISLLACSPRAQYHRRLMNDVTQLLSALGRGDPHAASRLLPLVRGSPRSAPVGRNLVRLAQSHGLIDELSIFVESCKPIRYPPGVSDSRPQSNTANR